MIGLKGRQDSVAYFIWFGLAILHVPGEFVIVRLLSLYTFSSQAICHSKS